MRQVVDEVGFREMLKLPRTILYISVNWSGQERISRSVVYNAFNEFENTKDQIFQIDCSDQQHKYFEDWLSTQVLFGKKTISNGYGETLLISKGKILDSIKDPGALGIEETKLKIRKWLM